MERRVHRVEEFHPVGNLLNLLRGSAEVTERTLAAYPGHSLVTGTLRTSPDTTWGAAIRHVV